MRSIVLASLSGAQAALANLIANEQAVGAIAAAGEALVRTFKQGGRVYSCGNGGSMCDAMHFAEELSGRFRDDRPALAALCISDPSHLTCVGNDYGFDAVFSRFIEAHGRKGDALLAISTSGKSANVIKAAEVAKTLGMTLIVLTGKTGSVLGKMADVEVATPGGTNYADRVQELHIKVIHSLIEICERGLFEQGGK